MKKWNFHRPAALPQKEGSRPVVQGNATPSVRRKSPSRRWSFHDPSKVNAPEGHGWHFDGPESQRVKQGRQYKLALGERWTCDYGCKSFVWSQSPGPGQYHAWDCPYWQNEGKNLTPF